ncbi:hypothetical protein ACWGLL_12910 [Brevundimonas sp. NPDC055814]
MTAAVFTRWVFAVLATSIFGALTVALLWLALAIINTFITGEGSAAFAAFIVPISLMLALPCFLVGAAVLGAPSAWALTRLKLDRAWPAALAGGLLATLGGASLLSHALGLTGMMFAVALPLAGAIGGLTYREMMRKPL